MDGITWTESVSEGWIGTSRIVRLCQSPAPFLWKVRYVSVGVEYDLRCVPLFLPVFSPCVHGCPGQLMLPVTSCFSSPPMRCSSPFVPGIAQGLTRSSLRLHGRKVSLQHGRCECYRYLRQVFRLREFPGLRTVGNVAVAQKHDRGHMLNGDAAGFKCCHEGITRVRAAMTGMGHSPLRPYNAWSRSVCSVLVGRPVLGPAR